MLLGCTGGERGVAAEGPVLVRHALMRSRACKGHGTARTRARSHTYGSGQPPAEVVHLVHAAVAGAAVVHAQRPRRGVAYGRGAPLARHEAHARCGRPLRADEACGAGQRGGGGGRRGQHQSSQGVLNRFGKAAGVGIGGPSRHATHGSAVGALRSYASVQAVAAGGLSMLKVG